PLKSPVPAIVHGLGGERGGDPLFGRIVPRWMIQITTCPVVGLYQRMSLIPSPSKSPVPAIVHGVGGNRLSATPVGGSGVGCMNQITLCRVVLLNQRMSPSPSPSKSPVPATAQSVVTVPSERLSGNGSTSGPFSDQSTSSPVLPLRQRMSLVPS